jgi:hypothetical protein
MWQIKLIFVVSLPKTRAAMDHTIYISHISENPVTVNNYWLKLVTATGIVGWSKFSTSSDNRIIGYLITNSYQLEPNYLHR